MLRLETEDGWWLITHQDHARLAGSFAERWGNDDFQRPEPRDSVLRGISMHDDGWAKRDAEPQVTRKGLPSAFSVELVGKYSAFEEIDLADYLAVRENAVRIVSEQDAYAGLLVALHTHNLLTARADRSTIRADQLSLLDEFLARLDALETKLFANIASAASPGFDKEEVDDHFKLLQATDNLSLLSCVDYQQPATLLHALPLRSGDYAEVAVRSCGSRCFRLEPWPFSQPEITLALPARRVRPKQFADSAALTSAFRAAEVEQLEVRLVG